MRRQRGKVLYLLLLLLLILVLIVLVPLCTAHTLWLDTCLQLSGVSSAPARHSLKVCVCVPNSLWTYAYDTTLQLLRIHLPSSFFAVWPSCTQTKQTTPK